MCRWYYYPWLGSCRCGFGPHAHPFWRTAHPLDELEATRERLRRELKNIEDEIERIKGKRKEQEG